MRRVTHVSGTICHLSLGSGIPLSVRQLARFNAGVDFYGPWKNQGVRLGLPIEAPLKDGSKSEMRVDATRDNEIFPSHQHGSILAEMTAQILVVDLCS